MPIHCGVLPVLRTRFEGRSEMLHSQSVCLMALYITFCIGLSPLCAGVAFEPAIGRVSLGSGSCCGRISVANTGPEGQRFFVRSSAAVPTANAVSQPAGNCDPTSWITFLPREFTLGPGARQSVQFTVSPHECPAAGLYQVRIEVFTDASRPPCAAGAIIISVDPAVSVQPVVSSVDCHNLDIGSTATTTRFFVHSNVKRVRLNALVTPLTCRAANGGGYSPIPPDLVRGVLITPCDPACSAGQQTAHFAGSGPTIGGASTQGTETLTLESGNSTGYHGEVLVTVWWQQNDPYRRAGKYAASVELVASAGSDN